MDNTIHKGALSYIVLGAIAILVIGGILYFTQDEKPTDNTVMSGENAAQEEMTEGNEMMDDGESMEEGDRMGSDAMTGEEDAMMDEGVMEKSGSYEAYDANKLARAENGNVVLFFRAEWCPTCRALDADIKENADNIPEGVTILDVNYDKETALKQKYGVTYQHTLVQVDTEGNQITKWSGSPTLSALLSNIK